MSSRFRADRSSTFFTPWIAWYIGTVPTGTVLAAMIACRIASILPPVERSMTVSEPRSTAIFSLASSLSMLEVTAELPMLALILHRALMPMPIGCKPSRRCTVFAGMIIRPRATSDRTSSGSRFSRRATNSISAEITPRRASSICVIIKRPPRTAPLHQPKLSDSLGCGSDSKLHRRPWTAMRSIRLDARWRSLHLM